MKVNAALVERVREYYSLNANKPNGGLNWLRVLVAFGASDSDVPAYTAREARQAEKIWGGWREVREALEAIEASGEPATPDDPDTARAADMEQLRSRFPVWTREQADQYYKDKGLAQWCRVVANRATVLKYGNKHAIYGYGDSGDNRGKLVALSGESLVREGDTPTPAPEPEPTPTPPAPRQDYNAPLMAGITEEAGYRKPFIEFMRFHLVDPRQSPFDPVYEWARGHVAADRGMPGCRCMQNRIRMLDQPGQWKDSLEKYAKLHGKTLAAKYRDTKTYGGSPAPAKEGKKPYAPPPPPTPRKPEPVGMDEVALRARIEEERAQVSRRQVIKAVKESALQELNVEFSGDGTLTALPMALWTELLEWSDVDRVEYVKDKRTCSTFAVALAGQIALRFAVDGIGLVRDWSGGHAYCALLVKDTAKGGVYVVPCEPQTDGLPQVGEQKSASESYKANRGDIVFF